MIICEYFVAFGVGVYIFLNEETHWLDVRRKKGRQRNTKKNGPECLKGARGHVKS